VTNPSTGTRSVKVGLSQRYQSGEDIWGKETVAIEGGQVMVNVGGRDAAVIALR
jgi:hypothetical protein